MSISVMIVDDDVDDMEMFVEAINAVDPTVACLQAKDGIRGLARVNNAAQKPAIIFVDMNMPKMTGQEFVAEVRKNHACDGIKLIIYSTSRPDSTVLHGADGFISKPTRLEDLCIEIARVIKGDGDVHAPAT
ncbi:MAG TPA: response regulator [Cyclobacteriaceae bacterium]|nr:response regulator [Cyclobacteriaceae bacterium]